MSKYRIVDSDCHLLEPPDIWTNWLPEKHQAPKLVKDSQGGDAWQTAVGGDPDPIGLTATPGLPFDEFRWLGVTYEETRTGCYNGTERLKDMDIDGVSAEFLYAPQRTMSHFLGDEDPDFVLAGVDAYNNFLFDEFCVPDPTRLIGLAQIPSLGIDSAVDGQLEMTTPLAPRALALRRPAAPRASSSPTGRRAASPRPPTTIRSGPPRSTRASRCRSTSTSSAARPA
jgi:hypothetical protein